MEVRGEYLHDRLSGERVSYLFAKAARQEPWDFVMIDEGSSMISAVFLIRCLWISYESRLRAGAKPFL